MQLEGLAVESELIHIIITDAIEDTENLREKRRTDLVKAWNAVVDCPSFENLQTLKWCFGEWAYDKDNSYAGAQLSIDYGKNQTTVVMEIGGIVMRTTFEKYFPPSAYNCGEKDMQSPGVCIVEPCGWIEGWPDDNGGY
jgi:hypothetical protein